MTLEEVTRHFSIALLGGAAWPQADLIDYLRRHVSNQTITLDAKQHGALFGSDICPLRNCAVLIIKAPDLGHNGMPFGTVLKQVTAPLNVICLGKLSPDAGEGLVGELQAQGRFFSLPRDSSLETIESFTNAMVAKWRGDLALVRVRDAQAAEASHREKELKESKSHFLSIMSHELRTPLNAIIGFSDLMRQELAGPLDNPDYRNYVDEIHASGSHLLNGITQVLEASQIEAGTYELAESQVEMTSLIEETAMRAERLAIQKPIALYYEFNGLRPLLKADARMLEKMLFNLLSNAIKFSPGKASVRITLGSCERGGLIISVIDQGIGISSSDIGRSLLSFSQIETGLNRRYDGVGLGLSLTKAMVEAHGGRLELEGIPHQGTTARLVFPPERLVESTSSQADRQAVQ